MVLGSKNTPAHSKPCALRSAYFNGYGMLCNEGWNLTGSETLRWSSGSHSSQCLPAPAGSCEESNSFEGGKLREAKCPQVVH